MSRITTSEVVKAFIDSHHGWSVAEQFEDSFNNGDFESQNTNALEYIAESVEDLIESNCLSKDCNIELGNYLENLNDFLKESETSDINKW
jgi:hypothetical protein